MTDHSNLKIINNVVSGLYSATIPEKKPSDSNKVPARVNGVAIGADHGDRSHHIVAVARLRLDAQVVLLVEDGHFHHTNAEEDDH